MLINEIVFVYTFERKLLLCDIVLLYKMFIIDQIIIFFIY